MMKRFVLALISVIGAGICGCNIDLAVDSDAAKCIKVGGIWDNKVCKKNPADSRFNDDEDRYICKDKDLVVSENHGLITIGKCQTLCNNDVCDPCQSCKEITEDGERRFKVSYCYDDKKFKICSTLGCNDDNTDCKETEVDSFCVEIEGISFLCTKENCIKCDNCENNICKDCGEHSADSKTQRCIDSKVEVCKNGVWVFDHACQPDWICDEDNYECRQVDDDGNGVTEDNDGNGGTEDNDDNGNGDDKCNSNSDTPRCQDGLLQTCNEEGNWKNESVDTTCLDGIVYHCNGAEQPESAECAGTCDGNKCQSCEEAITQPSGERITWCNINNEGCNRASSVWNSGAYVACADNGECKDGTGCTTLNPEEACETTGGVLSPDGECICKVNGEFKNCGYEGCFATNVCSPLECEKLANFCFDGYSYQCKNNSGINILEKNECGKLGCNSNTGTCVECNEGYKQCSNYNTSDGNILRICKDGKWKKDDTCNNECYKDECVDMDNQSCSEEENGNLRCVNVMGSGSEVFVCDNMKWTTTNVACSDGMCNAKYTNCNDSSAVCNKGYKKCGNDNKLYICENGKWEEKKFEKYEQCQNGKYVNLKEDCEGSGGDFSTGKCICRGNDGVLYTCQNSNCRDTQTCEKKECSNSIIMYCINVDKNFYTCNNNAWVKNEKMEYSVMYDYYSNSTKIMNLRKVNEKVIKGLMVDMSCNYEIRIIIDGGTQCVLNYRNEAFNFDDADCSKILEQKLMNIGFNIGLQSDGRCGSREENLGQCSIIIEKCENTDMSDPDNITFKVDCSDA